MDYKTKEIHGFSMIYMYYFSFIPDVQTYAVQTPKLFCIFGYETIIPFDNLHFFVAFGMYRHRQRNHN